jgi:hypothetical protein
VRRRHPLLPSLSLPSPLLFPVASSPPMLATPPAGRRGSSPQPRHHRRQILPPRDTVERQEEDQKQVAPLPMTMTEAVGLLLPISRPILFCGPRRPPLVARPRTLSCRRGIHRRSPSQPGARGPLPPRVCPTPRHRRRHL